MVETSVGILGYGLGASKAAYAFRVMLKEITHDTPSEEIDLRIMDIATRDQTVRKVLEYYGYRPNNAK